MAPFDEDRRPAKKGKPRAQGVTRPKAVGARARLASDAAIDRIAAQLRAIQGRPAKGGRPAPGKIGPERRVHHDSHRINQKPRTFPALQPHVGFRTPPKKCNANNEINNNARDFCQNIPDILQEKCPKTDDVKAQETERTVDRPEPKKIGGAARTRRRALPPFTFSCIEGPRHIAEGRDDRPTLKGLRITIKTPARQGQPSPWPAAKANGGHLI